MNCNLPHAFNEGLKLLALLSDRMREAGAAMPVVAGASAVGIHSNGAFPVTEIEISVQDISLCQAELGRLGFHADERQLGKSRFWNRELSIGVRISARVPFRGKVPGARQVNFETGCGPVRVISLEDTIAELVAAFDANPRGEQERLEQAARLYKAATGFNRSYLDARIREETLGRSLSWFVGLTALRTAVARRA